MTWVATGTATLTAAEIAAAEAAAVAAAEIAASTAAAEAAAATAASGASTAASTAAATEAATTTAGAITSAVPEVATAATTPTGIAAVPEAATVVPEAATPIEAATPMYPEPPMTMEGEIINFNPQSGINQVANMPSNVVSDVGVNPDFTAWKNAIDTNQFVPQDNTLFNAMQNVNAPTTPTSYTPEQLNQLAQSQGVFPEGSPALPGSEVTGNASLPPNTATPPSNSFMEGFTKFAKDNPFTTAMLGYGALSATGMFNANAGTAPTTTYAKSPTLSPNFRGGPYTQPNVYKPRYSSYATGGITDVGPVERMGAQNVGNQFYPQGQQDHTQFATPTQMPTSAEVVRSDYDPKTNAYTGQMNMASGGIAGYKRGGEPDSAVPQVFTDMMDPYAKYRVMDNSSSIKGSGIVSDDDPDTRYADALTAALTRQGKIDKRANFSGNKMKKPVPMGTLNLAPANVQEAASGGIMGYSLGGYAAGGNPRLLKGPGDGMSDNIPATIGGRQPARLADGEFVVPADVVSHLGNGSTNAGAKKLHGMMDKVRMDRTGKKKQAPAVNPNKYLPKK